MLLDLDFVKLETGDIVTVRGNWPGDFLARVTYVPASQNRKGVYRKVDFPFRRNLPIGRLVVPFAGEEMYMFSPGSAVQVYRAKEAFGNLTGEDRDIAGSIASGFSAYGIPESAQGLTGSAHLGLKRSLGDFDWVIYGRGNVESAKWTVAEFFGKLPLETKIPKSPKLFQKYKELLGLGREQLLSAFDTQWTYFEHMGKRASLHFVDPAQEAAEIEITGGRVITEAPITSIEDSYFSPRVYEIGHREYKGIVSWLFLLRGAFKEGDMVRVEGTPCIIGGSPYIYIGKENDRIEVI